MVLKGEKNIKIKTKGNWQAKGMNIEVHYNLAVKVCNNPDLSALIYPSVTETI